MEAAGNLSVKSVAVARAEGAGKGMTGGVARSARQGSQRATRADMRARCRVRRVRATRLWEQAGARGELGRASWAVGAGMKGKEWEKSWSKCGPRGEGRRGRLGRPGKEIERAEGRGVRGLGLEPSWAGFFWVLG